MAKPLDMSWDHWVEHQILQAQRDGAFDHLGSGPVRELQRSYRENWWLENLMQREDLHQQVRMPTAMGGIREELAALNQCSCEDEVRLRVASINERLQRMAAAVHTRAPVIDCEAALRNWREAQSR